MSKTANRVLSMVIAVIMLLSSMAVFAVADETAQPFVDAYDGTVIPTTALLVDSTITAAEVESSATITRAWDGKDYLFTAGVNAFSSFTDAYAYAKAEAIERPAIIVTGWGETTEVVISMASDVYAPNWNTVPMNEMSDDFDAIASNGADWTANPDFAANELKIGTITVNGDVQGSASIHGFTLTKFIQHDSKRNANSTKFEFLIKNSKMSGVSTNSNILKGTGNTSTKNEDKITFKNFWLDTIGGTSSSASRFFGDNTRHSSHIEFDGLYVDMSKASFLKTNDHLKAYAENTSVTFKNSNLRKSTNSASPYWNFAQVNTDAVTEYTRTLTFENNVMYNWNNNGSVINNLALGTHKSPNVIVVENNYVINTYAARKLLNAANNVTVTGNKLLGVTDQTITGGSAADNFLVTSVLTSAEEYDKAVSTPYSGSESFYVDSAMTVKNTDLTETFNEKLAAGININNVAFTAADTAVVVPTAKTITIGSDKVAFLAFGGDFYEFVVDNVNVFDVATGSDLSTVTGLAGKTNIILPTGNYGNLTLLPTSANYYGSNIGVDPIDKSGATLENNYDWALSDEWDILYETKINRLTVPAAAEGTILVDGITITKDIADQARLVTNESLELTFQNIVHDAPASDTTAVFYMHNGRSTNDTDAENGAKNADLTTIKNYYVKNHTSRQFLHETINANVVIDNLYWNTEITGQQRSTLGFLKHGSAVANTSFTIKNSNLRVAAAAKSEGYSPIMLYEQYGLDVTIEDNIFLQNYSGTSSNAIYTSKEADTCYFGTVKINNNMFIGNVANAYAFGSNGNVGFYDVAEDSQVDNNVFVGYSADKVTMGGLTLTNTFVSTDKTAASKPDEKLGIYVEAMGENAYYLDYDKNYINTGIEINEVTVTNGEATVVGKDIIYEVTGSPEETITSASFVTGDNGGKPVTVTLATDDAFENVIESYDVSTLDGAKKLYVKVAYTDKIYNVYTISIIDGSLEVFNDKLAAKNDADEEIGVTINKVTFKASDTAVYLPKDAVVVTQDDQQVAYLKFFGTNYKFVVDGVNVFANKGSDLSALSAFQGKKIILTTGNYGDINIKYAADFYGSNFGINPSDKSGADASNKYDWEFNENWDKANATVTGIIQVLAGVVGEDLRFDGVAFARFDDDARLLTDGALYAQFKNSIIANGGAGNFVHAVFVTSNKRTQNFTNAEIGANNHDSLLIKDVYVESTGTNQLLHEFNVPNITIDGLYLNGVESGKGRPVISFFKSSYLHDSHIVIKNSNIRNGGIKSGDNNLFLFAGSLSSTSTSGYTVGAGMSVEITDNYIVDGQNKASAIFVPNASSVGSFVVENNTIITTSGEKLFATNNYANATDETSPLIGNVTFDGNKIAGFKAANVTMDAKWGTLKNTYYSSTLDGLTDGDSITGEYVAAMGENAYYLDYNQNCLNTGIEVEQVNAENAVVTTEDDVITLTVDNTPDYAITADTFVTGDAGDKEVTKILATDAACENAIDSYNFKNLKGGKVLYLKVMYTANQKVAKTYTIKILNDTIELFNDKLANGLTVGNYDLTTENTAVYLPKDAEMIDGGAYLEFADTVYKFVVDGINVFANNAFASIDKDYVVLPAGTYGNLTINKAVTFIGSNVGINPSDKSNESANTFFEWEFNEDWKENAATTIGIITIPSGITGEELVFDGITLTNNFVDISRTTSNGSLNITMVNSVIDAPAPSNANAIFRMRNGRTETVTDAEFGANYTDTLTLKDTYIKTAKCNQIFDEYNPNIVIDGVYLDSAKALRNRSILSFFKTSTVNHVTIDIRNSNLRNGVNGNSIFTLGGNASSTSSMSVTVENNILYNAQGDTVALFNITNNNYVTELNILNNTFIATDIKSNLITGRTAALDGNITVDGNKFAGFTQANLAFDSLGYENDIELVNTYFSTTLDGIEDPTAKTGEYTIAMGSNPCFLDFNKTIVSEEYEAFVGNYVNDVISDEALLVDTTIKADQVTNGEDVFRSWDGQIYKFTGGVNAFDTLAGAFAKAVELGIECPDIIVTSYDMSNGVGGETTPVVSNHNMIVTMPCNIYGRAWNTAPMNEMNDDFNALESENKDWTLNTDFVSTVETIIPDDVTSVNHIFIDSSVVGNVKFAGLRVLDQLHFGGAASGVYRDETAGEINITVENTLLQIKPGKTWGGAVIDTMYKNGNPGVTNNDSLTFKNVWFKNVRKTELCGQEVVPSTFVLDSVYMAMDHFTAHTFIKGNGTNVKHIYKDSYFAINEDDTYFVFGGGTAGIDEANVESAELVFDNNVFNNYDDSNDNIMLDINPEAYSSIKFTNNFVYSTEDASKSVFRARTNFGDNVEISGNTILGFSADNTIASLAETATIDAKENFIVTKVCQSLDEYKAEVGSGFNGTTTYVDGEQTFYYDYARECLNIGTKVTGIVADVMNATITDGNISFSVYENSQVITADMFSTTNATKAVVKTLATDAEFASTVDNYAITTEPATLYLKVAYADTTYPETVYEINITAEHEFELIPAKEATCTEDGYTEHTFCPHCGQKEGYEVIPAGHDLIDVPAKDKTCTEDGYTAHTACTKCDYKEGYEVIPAGHSFTNKPSQTPAPDGGFYIQCDYCDVVSDTITSGPINLENQTTGRVYSSITEAINDADAGETVALTADVTATDVVLNPDITLDLNGFGLTVDNFVSLSGSAVIDTSYVVDRVVNEKYNVSGATKSGALYVEKSNIIMQASQSRDDAKSMNTAYMPIYEAENGCYRFVQAEMRYSKVYIEDSRFVFLPIIGANSAERNGIQKDLLASSNYADSGIQIGVKVSWSTDGYSTVREYTMLEYKAKAYINSFGYVNNDKFVNNYSKINRVKFTTNEQQQSEKVYISAIITSETGMKLESQVFEIDPETLLPDPIPEESTPE